MKSSNTNRVRHYGPPRLCSAAAVPAGAGAAAAPRAEQLGLARTELGEGGRGGARGVTRCLPQSVSGRKRGEMSHASLQAASPGRCKAYSSSRSLGCPVGTGEMPLPGINGCPRSASLPDLDVGGISEVLPCHSLPHLASPHPIVRVRGERGGDGVS